MPASPASPVQAQPHAALRPIEDAYPLTRMQQALLMRCLAYPDQPLYMGQWWAMLEGALDGDRFSAAWQAAVDRHTALRSGFHWDLKDHPFQVVHRQTPLNVSVLDWTDRGAWRPRLDEFLANDRALPFDIRKPPLMRIALLRLTPTRHILVWTRHHLTVDGWSLGIILNDVFALYRAALEGRQPGLPPAPTYRRYVDWEKSCDPEAGRRYWRALLADEAQNEERATAARRASTTDTASPVIKAHRTDLPATLAKALDELARCTHVTVNTLVQGAWALVQARLHDSDTVLFGAVEALRPAAIDSESHAGLVGIQIQIQPVLAKVDERPLDAWLRALQAQAAAARDAGPVGMDDLRSLLALAPDALPFDSLVGFQNYPLDEAGALAGSGLTLLETGDVTLPDMPLNLMVERQAGGLVLHLMVDERHIDASGARLRLNMLAHTLASLPDQAQTAVRDIEALPAGIMQAQLEGDGETPALSASTVIDAILGYATQRPDAPAVVHGTEQISYARLLAQAHVIAARLSAVGIGRGDRVGIHLERSPLGIAAILGTLLGGASYVPLDMDAPTERKRYMATQANLAAVIAIGTLDFADAAAIDVSELHDFAAPATPQATPAMTAQRPQVSDEAYVIFTSGSTGRPKGVSVTHGNLAYHVAARLAAYPDRPNRRLLLTFPLIFDGSVTGIFGTLATGGTLVLPRAVEANDPDRLAALIRREGVTQTIMIPSQWSLLISAGEPTDFATLQLAVVAGEACPRDLVERHGARLPTVALSNEYGPTETTVWASWEICRPGDDGPVSIGRAIPGMRCYVVDSRGRLCPPEVPGELWIAGPAVARGYVGQPELTAERFVANPFSNDKTYETAYRSGDRVTRGRDGKLRFEGRTDEQVKISGYRIELPEIEACLCEMPGIDEAIVLAQRSGQATPQLAAHVAGAQLPSREAILRHLQHLLPDYMVPQHVMLHDQLPRTPTGKVDKRNLPEVQRQQAATVAPQGELECSIASVWQAVLSCPGIGRHDNFFSIGGRSLDAMQMVSRLRRDLKLAVELIDLFEAPRLADFAARLAGRDADEGPGLRKRTRTRVNLTPGAAQ
ncbi:non-ribosomal peptide synthetase [Pollutimonas thiosulfatoxidans]|nr:non-ribosomal peptide synthetase [Pollutimonas thiosulfatoxidans]